MILLLASALAAEPHVDLDALFTYSIGGQSALGGELITTVGAASWQKPKVGGSLDIGLLTGFQAEPWSMAPWIDHDTTTGMTSRVRLLPSVGHSFHFGSKTQVSFGLHLYGGLVVWTSSGRIVLPEHDIDRQETVTRAVGDVGGMLRLQVRPHPVVGASILIGGPFYGLTSSSYAVDLFTVGAGLTFRLR